MFLKKLNISMHKMAMLFLKPYFGQIWINGDSDVDFFNKYWMGLTYYVAR